LDSLSLYLPPTAGVLLTQETPTPLNAAAIDAAIQVSQPVEPAENTPTVALNERERLALPDIELPINVALRSLLITNV
ncbi:hypothetical protein R0K05_25265, partial [Planococcus sp. SIMBA_160]